MFWIIWQIFSQWSTLSVKFSSSRKMGVSTCIWTELYFVFIGGVGHWFRCLLGICKFRPNYWSSRHSISWTPYLRSCPMNTPWSLDVSSVLADDAFQVVIACIRHVVRIVVHAVVFVLADFRLENLKKKTIFHWISLFQKVPTYLGCIADYHIAYVIFLWIINISLSVNCISK